ncbi:FGGY family of carbohydrate kinases, N-terminal domain [Musa troglodytarum]|uniref:FGGY family of carbohydrate kinases, N-terminal domain n=1 Tax=Musa troglodytarum TaxID=320322 RepID=A0A9E7HYI4_9LILI|nr:FGGY family of carbohydrate kinases, N-terminal domain [Musa troglodytarum]
MPAARKWSSSSLSETSPLLPSSASIEMSSNTGESSSAARRAVFLGVDVGTGSSRAGLFDEQGRLIGSASSPIQIWKEKDCIEQSSTDIWHAVCTAVKAACSLASVVPEEVVGLGFAATCSLVAVDSDGSPVSVSWTGDARRNIIVWMDHRAVNQAERINANDSPVLQYCGGSLSPEMQAPKELGLLVGTPVGTALIDAHAGGVGTMESLPETESKDNVANEEAICHRMVLVCGTSTCHMAVSRNKLFIPGVWGPFWSAMVPEYWLTEGGQSATGALLDHIIENHVAAPLLANRAASQSISIYELLNKILESMMQERKVLFVSALTEDMHVLPDFHGNSLYSANEMEIMLGCCIILPRESETVLLGAAILGAVAAQKYTGLHEAMRALNAAGQVIHPSEDAKVKKYHDAKYQIFKSLYEQQLSHRSIMTQALQ